MHAIGIADDHHSIRGNGATLLAVFGDEPPERILAMLTNCAAQDWDGRLGVIIAASPAAVKPTKAALGDWDRGRALVVENPTGRRTVGLNRPLQRSEASSATQSR